MLPEARMPYIPVSENNQGAVQLAQNPNSNSNSKHFNVRHQFLRVLVGRKQMSIIHVLPSFQHADFLTIAISRESSEFHRSLAMNLWGSYCCKC